MDAFSLALYAALAIAIIGTLFKARRWLHLSALSPKHIPGALWGLINDVFAQRRIVQLSPVRWVMHMLIFVGFMGLLVMHGMDELTSENWFSDYQPTLDPFQWLRDAFGLMALIGLGIATVRRFASQKLLRVTTFQDWALIGVIASIMASGILLESAKIISPHVFDRMQEEFLGSEDAEEINALKLLWATEYGAVFSPAPTGGEDALEFGREINDESCVYCHSPMDSAFVALPVAKTLTSSAVHLNANRADLWLYWVHVLLCFTGLALLPWAKFFHPVSTTINLMARKGITHSTSGSTATRSLGMDACTHCGACSEHCSVAPSNTILGTPEILPSEKLDTLAAHVRRGLSRGHLMDLAEGSHICTECLRCTEICPAGIDLQDLWMHSKQTLRAQDQGDPHAKRNKRHGSQWVATFDRLPQAPEESQRTVMLSDRAESFWGCIQCTTCTSVCPVVAASENPTHELDLMPQQIMNMLRMGLKNETLGSGMVWNCVTCYKCQEHCPQGVRVADVLYELRNIAAGRMRHTDTGDDS